MTSLIGEWNCDSMTGGNRDCRSGEERSRARCGFLKPDMENREGSVRNFSGRIGAFSSFPPISKTDTVLILAFEMTSNMSGVDSHSHLFPWT